MEIIKWVLMIGGIFGFLIIGCLMLLKSEDSKKNKTKQYLETVDAINQTNEVLDKTLTELEEVNEPLKKICNQINKFNDKFLK